MSSPCSGSHSQSLVSTPVVPSPCSSSSPAVSSPLASAELTSSAQKRRLARQAQRGIAVQPLPPIVTSPELLRDSGREHRNQTTQQSQLQPQHVSPAATTAAMDESAADKQTKTADTTTPPHGRSTVAPSSCRRFRFANTNEGGPHASPAQPPHDIAALAHSQSPSTGAADVVDVRIQRLEERCRELEEAKRRSHAAWMEELSSQALIQQQLIGQRLTIEELERQTESLTQQRDTHATRVQQLQSEMSASRQRQLDDGGRLVRLQEQHSFLDDVSEQQSAAIATLKADVLVKEQQLATLQWCLEAERRRYEELRGGVDGSLASSQQLRATLEATQAELQAVSQDKEQLVLHMDALEQQVNEATAREQRRAAEEREANRRAQAERKQLVAKWEESESERQQLAQQSTQLQADVVHWQHQYQNEADSHTVLQHTVALTARQAATSPASDAAMLPLSEQKEERVSRLAAVRRQLTEMRDNISQRLAAIRPVKRKDDRLLALQAELERSEAEMERLLKEHEATWQQVNRARRERCLSCGGFHHGSHAAHQHDAADSSEKLPAHVVAKDGLLGETMAFNRRLLADNAALRERVEALMNERDEALRRPSAPSGASGGRRGSKRDKRARDSDDKENEAVLQPMDVNAASGDRKHRRSLTASGDDKRRPSSGITADC